MEPARSKEGGHESDLRKWTSVVSVKEMNYDHRIGDCDWLLLLVVGQSMLQFAKIEEVTMEMPRLAR